ncbi:MAG: hypothetical protein AMXMBFR34_09690 [Myxococcaceae bacterium]
MHLLVRAVFALSLALSPLALAEDSSAGCEGAACGCGQKGEGARCPLHRPGAKKPARPAFDANTVSTRYGTVTAVERPSHAPGLVGVHLKVQVGKQTLTVHLGPADFVDSRLSFAEKDAVQFTGSNVTWEGQPTVLATVVTRGDKTVRLRQDDGTPLFRM